MNFKAQFLREMAYTLLKKELRMLYGAEAISCFKKGELQPNMIKTMSPQSLWRMPW